MRTVTLRVVCPDHPDGDFGLQEGRDALVAPGADRAMETTLECRETKPPRGKAVQGKAGDRFVYLALRDGNGGWRRRWKLSIEGIDWDALPDGATLETHAALTKATRPPVDWRTA